MQEEERKRWQESKGMRCKKESCCYASWRALMNVLIKTQGNENILYQNDGGCFARTWTQRESGQLVFLSFPPRLQIIRTNTQNVIDMRMYVRKICQGGQYGYKNRDAREFHRSFHVHTIAGGYARMYKSELYRIHNLSIFIDILFPQ